MHNRLLTLIEETNEVPFVEYNNVLFLVKNNLRKFYKLNYLIFKQFLK